MSKEALGEERGANARSVAPRPNERVCRLEEQDGELLPRLPNEIVLHEIIPKLPWRAFHVLSSVSRCWEKAIRSRQVYETRVCSHSTETLIAFNHTLSADVDVISLYSPRDKSWHRLPPLLHTDRGLPSGCQCVSVDGKIYVLGGHKESSDSSDDVNEAKRLLTEVYVLDLVGQTGWKHCTNMPEAREVFECGVLDGEIYLFGGKSSNGPSRRSFVYYTEENTWFSIMPMKSMRFDYHVVTVEEELFVYGGGYFDPDDERLERGVARAEDHYPGSVQKPAHFLEIYDTGEDEWRMVDPFNWEGWETAELLFTMKGKPYVIVSDEIYVHDVESGSEYGPWTHLHSISISNGDVDNDEFQVCALQAVDDELLAIVKLESAIGVVHHSLFQSNGFGSEEKGIVWETVDCSQITYPDDNLPLQNVPPFNFKCSVGVPFMCSIQL